ncbi:hypothetical protein ACJ41O_012965 [Fusarium nematophilum]
MADAQNATMEWAHVLQDPASLLRSERAPLILTTILVLPILFIAVKKLLFPPFDPREPPVLKPTIPLIGHIIRMVRERASWYKHLHDESSLPICTLPMLNGKMYIINSPDLISAALKNTDLSFDPFLTEAPKGLFGLNDKMIKIIDNKTVRDELMGIIHSALMGEPLYKMNVAALTKLMETLNGIEPGSTLDAPDTYSWLWDVVGTGTVYALFGEKTPYTSKDLHLIVEYEKGFARLVTRFAPWLIAPGPLRARTQLQKTLEPYYVAGHEKLPDVSAIISGRAAALRKAGFDDHDLGIQEITFPWAGTTNTIPTLFWLFVHLFTRPDLVERVRSEFGAIVTITDGDDGRIATISARETEKKCPFLLACYREILRLYVHNVGNRVTMKDTTIRDPQGNEYLLKKGVNVQWSSSLTHLLESVWGKDAESFSPERFLDVGPQEEKRRRGASIPFGGGKHLCPGRQFALAENLGFVGVLCLGFEVRGVHLPRSEDPAMGTGSRKPVWGDESRGVQISRRDGWEDVTWRFVQ